MILLDRVTKTYNKNLGPALDRVSLHVEPKEFVIIVGQSGAGKSTLLKLLTREERPTSGKIIVGGIDYDKLQRLRYSAASAQNRHRFSGLQATAEPYRFRKHRIRT